MQPTPQSRPGGPLRPRLIKLGSFFGVGIYITPSWLLVVALITLSYGDFMREVVRGASRQNGYLLALLFAVVIGLSVVLHELGHTAVSLLLGLRVKRIVVFLLGGVSELDGESGRPRDEFAIAAAGPAASLLLGAGCWALSLLPPTGSAAAVLLLLAAWSNVVIAVFNVLPGLPLDGGRLLQALIWRLSRSRLTGVRIAAQAGRVLAMLLTLAVVLANALLRGAHTDTLTITVLGLTVAGFLWLGASQALRAAQLADRTGSFELSRLIRPSVYLAPTVPVSEAVRYTAETRTSGIVVIDGDGRSRALVDEAELARVGARQRPWTTLAEVSRPLEDGLILRDDLNGEQVLAAVRATPASEYLVVSAVDGVSRGVLAVSDVARALGLRYRAN
ncbi:MAG TPA: M50 family metallopeptidase [Jatrophihabitans sp.]|nr:M50 family metallopeptidase [Jatrophihabitans sp.]